MVTFLSKNNRANKFNNRMPVANVEKNDNPFLINGCNSMGKESKLKKAFSKLQTGSESKSNSAVRRG